ncbi:M28 family peptidase [Neobacillus sp. NPDC093127]|uniref:M28 family peptidase n=1 Tax=Neobacillus sp. NPDC093127 TaxID=3364296 RepID=UPI00381D159E
MSSGLSPIEYEITSEIDSNQLMEFNREIAKEVRLSGSAEELRAFEYAKRTLESFGLSTKLTFHDAYISIPGPARLVAGNQEIACITHSMAPSTDVDGLKGTAVYIGEFSEEKLKLVDGRIAVVESIALPEILLQLEASKAIGAIFINGPYTHEMIVSTVWGSPSEENIDSIPKIPVISINNENGTTLKSLINQGENNVEIYARVDTKWIKTPTLTAEIRGNEEADHFVLFSGHIDSWHYGAMDNGSANATMIEAARVLSKFQKNMKRSLRFAFWSGHSHGRYSGSQNYCDSHWEEIHENCVMHFYVDSVGGKGATILSESNCMAETKEIAAEYVWKIAEQTFIGSRYGRYADQSFWGAGVPSLFMGMSEQPISDDPNSKMVFELFKGQKAGGFGWWWHTVEDTIDKIDPVNLKRDCEIYALSIYKVLTEPIVPINQVAAVKELKKLVGEYWAISSGHIDLDLTQNRLCHLETLLKEIYQHKTMDTLQKEDLKELNQGLIQISRILVPLNYVENDIFDHDPANKSCPIPALSSIRKMSEVEKNSHEFHLIQTSLRRKINKVNYSLKRAIDQTEALRLLVKEVQIK